MTEDNIPQTNTNQIPNTLDGIKCYGGLNKYIDSSGLKFNIEDCLSIENMKETLNVDIHKVGNCTLNDRENNPLRYKKNGEYCKKQKEIITDEDYDGVLVNFNGVNDEFWRKSNTEGIYFITFNKNIVKIGMTEKDFCDRFNSYICGSRRAMKKGSCSTTNFVICEVLYKALQLGLCVEIYGIHIPKEKKVIEAYGEKHIIPISVVRGYEEIITNKYKNIIGEIPPLCVQHASNV